MNHLERGREQVHDLPAPGIHIDFTLQFSIFAVSRCDRAAPNFVSFRDASGVEHGRPHRATPAGPLTEHSDIQFSSDPKEFWPRRSGSLPICATDVPMAPSSSGRLRDSAPQHAISLGPGSDLPCVIVGFC